MLLPTKGISFNRALLTVGADILENLDSATSISGLWDRLNRYRAESRASERITFDWFCLALAALYSIGAVEWTPAMNIRRTSVHQ